MPFVKLNPTAFPDNYKPAFRRPVTDPSDPKYRAVYDIARLILEETSTTLPLDQKYALYLLSSVLYDDLYHNVQSIAGNDPSRLVKLDPPFSELQSFISPGFLGSFLDLFNIPVYWPRTLPRIARSFLNNATLRFDPPAIIEKAGRSGPGKPNNDPSNFNFLHVGKRPVPDMPANVGFKEEWFYINGVMTSAETARLNRRHLRYLTHRDMTIIHNPTDGIFFDLIECAFGKIWDRASAPAMLGLIPIAQALANPDVKKVVVVAHSQGTIIAANILSLLKRCMYRYRRGPNYTGGDIPRPGEVPSNATNPNFVEKRHIWQIPRGPIDFALMPRNVPGRTLGAPPQYENIWHNNTNNNELMWAHATLVNAESYQKGRTNRKFKSNLPSNVVKPNFDIDLNELYIEKMDISKLEFYMFANCSTTMRYSNEVRVDNGNRAKENLVACIESFGNDKDLVAGLGCAAPTGYFAVNMRTQLGGHGVNMAHIDNYTQSGISIDGDIYIDDNYGHLLNNSYLETLEKQFLAGELGPDLPRFVKYFYGGTP